MVAALIASVSFVALAGASHEAVARPGGAPADGGIGGARPIARGAIARPFRHHNNARNTFGAFWPAVGGFYDGAAYGGGNPVIDVGQPNNIHYTYTYDVPWDWAHRYPPNVIPSDRPYVSSCSSEPVTVPGRNGGEKTINITRCY